MIENMRFPTENAFKSHTKFRAVKEISESFENMMQIMECTQDWINGNLPIPDFSPFCWYCQNCIRDEGFFTNSPKEYIKNYLQMLSSQSIQSYITLRKYKIVL